MTRSWTSALNEFSNCADKLHNAVMDIPDHDLDRSLDENNWSIRQIIHHLADAALIWSMFYRQVVGDSGGEFKLGWYWSKTQDEWGEIWKYSQREIGPALELYRSCNQSMVELLRSSDDPGDKHLLFSFPGEETQTMTVEGTVRWQKIHLKQHLVEIRNILTT